MRGESDADARALLDRMNQGDDAARREFLEHACDRLRRLAGSMLAGSFPSLHARHEVDSIVNETWIRLIPALEKSDPPTVADFFRFAAHKIRQVLLDLVERQRRLDAREVTGLMQDTESGGPVAAGGHSLDPARLALWSEFHQRVAQLPEEERTVVEMHYYLELPQAEIARLLGLHPRKVSHLWVAGTDRLADGLDGVADLL